MIDKPSSTGMVDFDALFNWALLIGLSLWGGFASFMRKIGNGHARPFNFTELIGELTISGFTGVVVAKICESMPPALMPEPLKYALVGIFAHMGSRGLFMLEKWATRKFNLPAEAPAPTEGKNNAAS